MPFWLEERSFRKTDLSAVVSREPIEVWQRDFEAGRIGLGINGWRDSRHCFAVLSPQKAGEKVAVGHMLPRGQAIQWRTSATLPSPSSTWGTCRPE